MQQAGALPEHSIRKAGRFFLGRRISSEHRKIIVVLRRVLAAVEIKLSFDHCPLRARLQNGVKRNGDPTSIGSKESAQTVGDSRRVTLRGHGVFAGRCTGYLRRGRVWISDERHCFAPFSSRVGKTNVLRARKCASARRNSIGKSR